MKNIYAILIISLFCFVGCSSNNNSQNPNNLQNTTNASNNTNNTNNAVADIGNGIGNAVDDAGNLVGNVISDAGTAIGDIGNDVGNGIENLTNNKSRTNANNSNVQLINNSQNQSNNSSALSQKATEIAKEINSIDGVNKATVILTNQTALIGLDLADSLNDEQISSIKRLAETKAKNSNNGIKNTAVTASPEVVQRITNLANDIKSGQSTSDLTDELRSLVKIISPNII